MTDPSVPRRYGITIPFNGGSRKYILRVPDGYDNKHPYRLVFAFAESGSSAMSVANRNYFTLATLDLVADDYRIILADHLTEISRCGEVVMQAAIGDEEHLTA